MLGTKLSNSEKKAGLTKSLVSLIAGSVLVHSLGPHRGHGCVLALGCKGEGSQRTMVQRGFVGAAHSPGRWVEPPAPWCPNFSYFLKNKSDPYEPFLPACVSTWPFSLPPLLAVLSWPQIADPSQQQAFTLNLANGRIAEVGGRKGMHEGIGSPRSPLQGHLGLVPSSSDDKAAVTPTPPSPRGFLWLQVLVTSLFPHHVSLRVNGVTITCDFLSACWNLCK